MINRRGFLSFLGAAPLVGALPNKAMSTARKPKNTVVVLDDIRATTDAPYLQQALQRCALAGIPITCLIEARGRSSPNLQPSDPVAEVLRNAAVEFGGLLEFCPCVANLGELTPYFQARAAFEAQKELERAIWGEDVGSDYRRPRLIACENTANPSAPSGLRSAGIRTVLMKPAKTTPTRSEAWDFGVVRIIGGIRLTSTDPHLPNEIKTASEQLYYFSIDEIAGSNLEERRSSLDALIEAVRPQSSNDWRSPVMASDVAFRDTYGYRRMVSFHLSIDEEGENLSSFQSLLQSLNIPFTTSPSAREGGTENSPPFWLPAEPTRTRSFHDKPKETENFFETETRETQITAEGLQEISVAFHYGDHAENVGLDRSGLLRMPAVHIDSKEFATNLSVDNLGFNDVTIVVYGTILASDHIRGLMSNLLRALQTDGYSLIVPFDEQARVLFPKSPSISHHRRTVAYRKATPAYIGGSRPLAVDQLVSDAKLAWSYFEKWTNPKTGLCPATVHQEGGSTTLHKAVTMWDVGSHINALIAAHRLDLISTKKFRRAVDKIRPNLAGRRSQDRLLPQGWIVTDRIKWGVKDFDGCDAGRLLSSLYNLDNYGVAGSVAEPIVQSWDLPEIVREGVIYSVKDGEMISTYKSHCTHYSAWAFKIWGLHAVSPYATDPSKTDGEMMLLEEAARIGPLGAEPLLLEALELEMSPESAFLADTLFAAQLEERRDTGLFTGVSECPIDRPPWFIYSGLDLGRAGRVWATDTVESLPEHRTAAFAERNLMMSSKAAYLWLAYNQHEYSSAMVQTVREKARTKNGFNSGIYQSSGQATSNTDLNTNGIILQSIASLLTKT